LENTGKKCKRHLRAGSEVKSPEKKRKRKKEKKKSPGCGMFHSPALGTHVSSLNILRGEGEGGKEVQIQFPIPFNSGSCHFYWLLPLCTFQLQNITKRCGFVLFLISPSYCRQLINLANEIKIFLKNLRCCVSVEVEHKYLDLSK